MSRIISRAESWETVYTAFQNINFTAFDFNTIKQSLLDYTKLTFPETFNDYIESSEFIAIIETFAYIAELLTYRVDINAHENFISTAQRRDSILRLAKLVSYAAARPLPARGLVKITSVSTSETVIDANGIDLSSQVVRWNDSSNTNWKEQFILIMNRVLDQEFGSVSPFDRFQLQDVLFELYGVDLISLPLGVFQYSVNVNGESLPMELVPVAYDSTYGIVERRPENNSNFTFLYGTDGNGDASDTTGFFCYTKQGTLQRFSTTFDGITPNQVYEINSTNVNDTDIWVNNVDPITRAILDIPPEFSFRVQDGRSGEWKQVDLAHAQNVIFNTNPNRNKYEVETRDENKVRLIFGDGEFADIPSGSFDVWVRSSVDEDIVVSQASAVNVPISFSYTDTFNRIQTFTFTCTLINSLQNASASENLEHIRVTAPAVYYTQDRMVNGEDYNIFMMQDPSIMKLRAVNRTFAGDSKYIPWHDNSESYENVKLFGDDAFLYLQDKEISTNTPVVDINTLIDGYVEPLLSTTDVVLQLVTAGVAIDDISRTFSAEEKESIAAAMFPPNKLVDLYYDMDNNLWVPMVVRSNPSYALISANTIPIGVPPQGLPLTGGSRGYVTYPPIGIWQPSPLVESYEVHRYARRVVVESNTTQFWNTNDADRIIDYDTLSSVNDQIVILKANTNHTKNGILSQNWNFDVLGQEVTAEGLQDIHRLVVLPTDSNGDGVPDYLDSTDSSSPQGIAEIFTPKIRMVGGVTAGDYIDTIIQYTSPLDIRVYTVHIDGGTGAEVKTYLAYGISWVEVFDDNDIGSQIYMNTTVVGMDVIVEVKEYVYFSRVDASSKWIPINTSYQTMLNYKHDLTNTVHLWQRFEGTGNLNFAWFHFSPRYHLVDPSPSNIIDTFIITKGYYIAFQRWMEDPLVVKPKTPTPLDLRTSYSYLLDNKMISDTVILHPGKLKLLFGARAIPELQAVFKIIKTQNSIMTDNQIKISVVNTIRNFFDITQWEFGETFYFSELATAIHLSLPSDISSVLLVPTLATNQFGDIFQVIAREDEMFYPDVTVDQIEMVSSYTAETLRQSVVQCGVVTNGPIVGPVLDPYCDITYCDSAYLIANSTPQ